MMRGVDPEKSQRMWRSLAEFDDTPATLAALKREFPPDAIAEPDELKRRTFLKLMAASLALAGCTRQPIQQMVPYVKQPEEVVLGEPLYFATAMPLGGFGTGILVKSREGRPIKADGNPLHPASGNGSSIWIQACLLDLYNPERAKSIRHFDQPSTYATFAGELNEYLRQQKAKKGAGLRILTQTVTSPTLSAQLGAILENFPEARWVQWEPFNWDNPLEGARLAFGEPWVTHYDMAKADVIACFESDFLYTHPQRLHYTRDFTNGRRVVAGGDRMNRLYVVESSPTVTGSMADNRLPLAPSKVERALYFVAKELGLELNGTDESLTDENRKWLAAMVFDLEAHRGNSVVLVGEGMPARLHALEQKINDRLKNFGETVTHTAPALARPENQLKGLAALRDEMASGACDLLLVIGGNPAFDAPADFDFAGALKNVKHAIHLSPESNETSRLCDWHLPEAHFLEAWSDIRSFDGTTTIMQPLIAPLFGGISEHELLDTVLHLQPVRGSYDIVREFWRGQKLWDDFEMGWRKAVHDGLIGGSALPKKKLELKAPSQDLSESSRESNDLELTFRPDPNLWDGRFASNPWLKETPKPLSKITWDNAAMIGPALAHRENLKDGDIVELQIGKRSVEAAVFLQPGQAHNTVTLHLGSGGAEQRHGFNFYPLRESGSPAYSTGLRLRKTGR
ncbi:MAG TPA: TAT-variant-translocated molybdopterin oxidoreductase, partial [Verrucomicrobiae bacterium]|nr:TAT-variant-translocated molybdopterin oxidoreductase [Verrucomicrobiae bacterium]